MGIGVASGEHMLVQSNKMYSDQWQHSNVAYYSWRIHSPCGFHSFPATPDPNKANWTNSNGTLNRAWTDENCGITHNQIWNNVDEDTGMGPEIWDDW